MTAIGPNRLGEPNCRVLLFTSNKNVSRSLTGVGMFHYRAVLREQSPAGVFMYSFYPDFLMASNVSGTFTLTQDAWQPSIIHAAGAEEIGLVSTDLRCVLALTSKIKAEFSATGRMPHEILRIS